MDANAYEQRVRETARAMGYDARTIDRMFSPEVNATVAASDARADATERHQEARRLALAHIAQEQAEADPGAAQAYEEGFVEFARAAGMDAATVEAMAALPVTGGASEARVADLTRRYSEALRVQGADAGGPEHGRPFEPTDEEFREPRIEDDERYRVMLDLARHVDRIAESKGEPATNERDVLRLWECRVALARADHARERTHRQAEAMLQQVEGSGTQRVQEAVSLQATDAGEEQAWEVVLCQAGPTKTGGRRYPEATLRDAVDRRLYDGAKMYLNHASERELATKPHRDVREWAATVRPGSVRFDPVTGSVIGIAVVHNRQAAAILASPTARAGIGLSADLTAKWAKAGDGLTDATAITTVHSVDFVPEANSVHGRSVIGPAA